MTLKVRSSILNTFSFDYTLTDLLYEGHYDPFSNLEMIKIGENVFEKSNLKSFIIISNVKDPLYLFYFESNHNCFSLVFRKIFYVNVLTVKVSYVPYCTFVVHKCDV